MEIFAKHMEYYHQRSYIYIPGSQADENVINENIDIHKNIFACLFSVHNTISLLRHEQVCLIRLRF